MKCLFQTGKLLPVPNPAYPNQRQCSKYALLLCLTFVSKFHFSLNAQYQPGLAAKFGIDGGVYSDERQAGTFTPAGSHDWFYKNSGTGIGIFDVNNAATANAEIAAGKNYSFAKKMQYPMFSIQDGLMLLDGTYARDFFGLGTTAENSDKSIFVSNNKESNKNHQDPATWTTVPNGGAIPNKTDIVDTYIHMRRNGTSTALGAPSDLIINLAASTLSTDGDHYIDFELFKSELSFDQSTGKFVGAGPTATGGRDIWEFNADRTVKTYGTITISFSYNSSSVSDISIFIWVPYITYNGLDPAKFDFVKGEFYGAVSNGGYGYAKIIPNAGTTLKAWANVNQAATAAPVWGTNSKSLGVLANNYYATQYSAGQFAEAAIDLTSSGVDPALTSEAGHCAFPFKRFMIKSRSSSSFSAALQDFVGPYKFYDNTEILPPSVVTCTNSQIGLATKGLIMGATYTWTTSNGNIVDGANTPTPKVDKGGEYTLTVKTADGCAPITEVVNVLEDVYKPVATAKQIGLLLNNPTSVVGLEGGDPVASNYTTPFGGSQGLSWSWKGPEGFSAKTQNATTNKEGEYQLTLTEQRNGCSALATLQINRVDDAILPLQLLSFTGSVVKDKVLLAWAVAENESGKIFEIQKCTDGHHFATTSTMFTSEVKGTDYYQFNDKVNQTGVYYRLLMINKDGSRAYSKAVFIGKTELSESKLNLLQNPVVAASLPFNIQVKNGGAYTLNIYALNGSRLMSKKISLTLGGNTYNLPVNNLQSGNYILELVGTGEKTTALFIKH